MGFDANIKDLLIQFLNKSWNMKGKRIINAGNSIDNQDYVTQKQLNDLGIQVGFGKDKTITDAVIQTSETNPKLILDSTNGLRAINGSGNLRAQLLTTGLFKIVEIDGLTDALSLKDSANNNEIRLSSGGLVQIFATDGTLVATLTKTQITFVPVTAVPLDAYSSGWNGSANVPTKDAIYDKIETLVGNATPLFNFFANAGNSTTTETDLYSSTLAANQLLTNGDKLQIEYGGTFVSSGTATRQIRIYFGGTVIFDTGTLTLSLSAGWVIYATIIRVSSTVIRYLVSLTTEGAALGAYTAVGELTGLTLSNTNILKITGQAAGVGAASNDIVAKLGDIIYTKAS